MKGNQKDFSSKLWTKKSGELNYQQKRQCSSLNLGESVGRRMCRRRLWIGWTTVYGKHRWCKVDRKTKKVLTK